MELLTFDAVAALLKKTPRGIRKDIVSGRFGPEILRLGRSVRVRADELAEWIRAGCPGRDAWTARNDGGRKAVKR